MMNFVPGTEVTLNMLMKQMIKSLHCKGSFRDPYKFQSCLYMTQAEIIE